MKNMKNHFWICLAVLLLAALLPAALLPSCETPTQSSGTENDETDDFDADYLAALRENIGFFSAGMVAETDTVEAGASVTTIYFPEIEGPWEAALVRGEGDTHNRLFRIAHYDADGNPLAVGGDDEAGDGEEIEPPARAELVIGDAAGPLDWGHYSARVRVRNEAGAAFRYTLTFDVGYSPPSFTDPPGMYPIVAKTDNSYPTMDMQYATGNLPDIATGSTKFVITWPRRASATSYTVEVSTDETFTTKATLGPIAAGSLTDHGKGILGTEIINFNGSALSNKTRYWARVNAANPSGATPFSPAANRKTSAPMPEYFYLNTNDEGDTKTITVGVEEKQIPSLHDCGGYGDYYRFTPTTVKYWFGTKGGYNYIGDVVYHEAYDVTATDNGPFLDKIKDGASCLGFPAGVFVIKYREDRIPSSMPVNKVTGKKNPYSAVYYWGMGTVKPPNSVPADMCGRVESDIVNQWGDGKHSDGRPHKYGAYAETVTYEEAIDRFTCENVAEFLGLDPEPYYKNFVTTDTRADPCNEPWIGEGAYDPDGYYP